MTTPWVKCNNSNYSILLQKPANDWSLSLSKRSIAEKLHIIPKSFIVSFGTAEKPEMIYEIVLNYFRFRILSFLYHIILKIQFLFPNFENIH